MKYYKRNITKNRNGNTLLEGVCIRLTWHLHNSFNSFMHVCDNGH